MKQVYIVIITIFTLLILSVWSWNVFSTKHELFDDLTPSLVNNGCVDYLQNNNIDLSQNINIPSNITDPKSIQKFKNDVLSARLDVLSNFTALRAEIDGDLNPEYAFLNACSIDPKTLKDVYRVKCDNCQIQGLKLDTGSGDADGKFQSEEVKFSLKNITDLSPEGVIDSNDQPVTSGCILDISNIDQFFRNIDELAKIKEYKTAKELNDVTSAKNHQINKLNSDNTSLKTSITGLNNDINNLNSSIKDVNNKNVVLNGQVVQLQSIVDSDKANQDALRQKNNFDINGTSCRDISTAPTIASGRAANDKWKTGYLASQDVGCQPDEFISRFQMRSSYNTGDKAFYDVRCCKYTGDNGNPTQSISNNFTKPDDYGSGKTVYLDRQKPDCTPSGSLLNEFKLNRVGKNQMDYSYTCAHQNTPNNYRVNKGLECYNAQTLPNTGNDNTGFNFTDRHDVRCQDGYGVGNFKLQRDKSGKNFWYDFVCCKPTIDWTDDPVLRKSIGG